MSEKFLSRGKRKDNGKFAYGNIVFTRSGRAFLLEGNFFTGEKSEGNFETGEIYGTELIPETVGRFTGYRDCSTTEECPKGRRIFEGDILRVTSEDYDYDYKTQVGGRFGDKTGTIVEGSFGDGNIIFLSWAIDWWEDENAEWKVIGNIYDNPELIQCKGEEK